MAVMRSPVVSRDCKEEGIAEIKNINIGLQVEYLSS